MTTEQPIRVVLIAGPTASGKSALALALARELGGAVVNADASQVYADLRVLTARPTEADEAKAPHRLYGHVDGGDAYAVGRWVSDVFMVAKELTGDVQLSDRLRISEPPRAEGRPAIPVLVGGTGLYFEALTAGLASVPEIPAEIRTRWRGTPPGDLYDELVRRDPAMAARLRPSDPQRLTRALEVFEATGRSLAAWQAETTPGPVAAADALRIVLAPDRAALDGAIARRLEAMIDAGARDEAERLFARGLDPATPVLKALGAAPFAAWARGEITREGALARTQLDTRRYAKRQSTWFRNRMADWIHVAPEKALEAAMAEIRRRGVDAPLMSRPRAGT
ncbi:tRNA dimethylallyltransferase [Hansschlegelia plantiphila]|uniref:tRNA dimethylallyltransferase n=2 Tax=Hansschlegelia plantiphila TaxID=374655 RepID=A0A9W6MWS2_9HYPH|nr:tRNA dimethylallyltransferase [Hansschlegelia plantiphila]